MNSATDYAPDITASPLAGRRVMVVTAHPDDETLGAGSSLAQAQHVTIIHVTDGTRSLLNSWSRGFATRRRHARARQRELERALAMIPPKKGLVQLHVPDQQVAFHIAGVARRLRQHLLECNPDLVLTHAFEGGHPDHDATAMAVHLALRSAGTAIPLYEMTGYHRASGKDVYGVFIPRSDVNASRICLSSSAQERKTVMLAAFVSQKSIVARFPIDAESFREAPSYRFTELPHEGRLFYEIRRFPMTGRLWQSLALRAEQDFESGSDSPHSWDWLLRATSVAKNVSTGYAMSASASRIIRS